MSNTNSQYKISIEKSLSLLSRIFVAILFIIFSVNSQAQDSCLISKLSISTGNNATGSPLQDPKWKVEGLSPDNLTVAAAHGITSLGYGAYIVPPEAPLWITSTSCSYLSFISSNNYSTDSTGIYIDTFTRTFQVCISDTIVLYAKIACDDQIKNILIDGISVYGGQSAPPNTGNFTVYTTVASAHLFLFSGTHTITVVAMNYSYQPTVVNYHGFALNGTVSSTTGTNSIVSESSGCKQYVCKSNIADSCDDFCYWKVTGNDIHYSNNLFGTLNNSDINIITDNTLRAIVKASGNIGINQLSPTTILDVNCVPPAGSTPSGLRLENLPVGSGSALVVDPSGYVYVSKTQAMASAPNSKDLQSQIDDLKQEISTLKGLLSSETAIGADKGSLTITPNPTSKYIKIKYSISAPYQNAFIQIVEVGNGKAVLSIPVTGQTGSEETDLSTCCSSNQLLAFLVIDGNVVATQKIIFIKD